MLNINRKNCQGYTSTMSFHINSDKEKIRESTPNLSVIMRLLLELELERRTRGIQAELDAQSGLPRVGINRTGQRVNNIRC